MPPYQHDKKTLYNPSNIDRQYPVPCKQIICRSWKKKTKGEGIYCETKGDIKPRKLSYF
jgi:hypothetical protein